VIKAILKHCPKNPDAVQNAANKQNFDFSDLESHSSKDWPNGISNLMKFLNETHLQKNPFSLNESLKISSAMMTFFESDDQTILTTIIDANVIPHLLTLEIIHLHDFFGPILELLDRELTEERKESVRELVTAIKEKHSKTELVELVFSSIKNTNIPNIGKNRGKKIRNSLSINKKILNWFIEHVETEDMGPFFSIYANIQFCMSKLVPLLQLKSATPELRDVILNVIQAIYESNAQGVLRSLETFDVEVSRLLKDFILPEHAESDIPDQTFAIDDEKSNVFDVKV
jgi:hypothetical protein